MKRIFIIGNGPSLREHDLDSLVGEETGALNRIPLIYGTTNWRPTRWWWTDHPQVSWQLRDIFEGVRREANCWIRSDICEMLTGEYRPFGAEWSFYDSLPASVHSWAYCNQHLASRVSEPNWPKVYHWPPDGSLCKVGTGASVMIAKAILEGYDRIYLLGCDAGFKPDLHHFDSEYLGGHEALTPEYCEQVNARIVGAHTLLRNAAQSREVSIQNISSSDALRDIYEYTTLPAALAQ